MLPDYYNQLDKIKSSPGSSLAVCHSIDCHCLVTEDGSDFCLDCLQKQQKGAAPGIGFIEPTLVQKYPKYFKDVSDVKELDVYLVHHLFDIQDPSGAIQHASKKLLLSGTRNGGKSFFQDVKEARDSLNRWLAINEA